MKQLKLEFSKETLKILIVACIIIVSDDTLFFGTNSNSVFEIVKYIILTGMLFILTVYRQRYFNIRKITHSQIICLMMCLLVLMTGIVNGDLRTGYFYKCIILLLSYEVVNCMTITEFAIYFEKVLYFFAVISVVLTLIAEINLSFFSIFPIFYNSANTPFYNLGVYLVPVSAGLLRNYGIFREPGVYQMFLLLGLVFHLFFSDEVRIYKIFAYILAIILTFSTTGYIALAIYLILYLNKNNITYFEQKKKFMIVCLVAIGMLIMATQTDLLSSQGRVFDKFSNMKRTTMIARFASIFANLKIWLEHPFFGAGLICVNEEFPKLALEMYGKAVTHNTNTLLSELSTYGIFYTLMLLNGYRKFSANITKNNAQRFLILLIIFILSCGEKLTFSPIIYILAFYGLKV